MSVQIKALAANATGTSLATTEADVYKSPNNKATIIKGIRLVNTGTTAATVNLYFRRTSTGTNVSVIPKDMMLPAGAAFVDDSEITLEGATAANGEDRIRGVSTVAGVHCLISGVERDV
jgi:hypothetical protein